MQIRTEADYQAAMRRLEYLLDHEPANLSEITALGNMVNAFENENGPAAARPAPSATRASAARAPAAPAQ